MEGEVDDEDGMFTNVPLADDSADCDSAALRFTLEEQLSTMNCDMDGDMENQVEVEEKTRLINQVLELQHTLSGFRPCDFSSCNTMKSVLNTD